MTMTEAQRKELMEAAKPLMKWLCDNVHPHVEVRVDMTDVTVAEHVFHDRNEEFIKD